MTAHARSVSSGESAPALGSRTSPASAYRYPIRVYRSGSSARADYSLYCTRRYFNSDPSTASLSSSSLVRNDERAPQQANPIALSTHLTSSNLIRHVRHQRQNMRPHRACSCTRAAPKYAARIALPSGSTTTTRGSRESSVCLPLCLSTYTKSTRGARCAPTMTGCTTTHHSIDAHQCHP